MWIDLQVATSAMDNQLLRYSAKDYFFRALVCRMCFEVQDASTAMAKYEEMFPAFSDSRECKLVKVSPCFLYTSNSGSDSVCYQITQASFTLSYLVYTNANLEDKLNKNHTF